MKVKRTFKEISTRHGQVEILDRHGFRKATALVEIFKGKNDNDRAEGRGSLGYGNTLAALGQLDQGSAVQTFFSVYEPV